MRVVSSAPLDWLATSFTGCRSVIERRQSRPPLLSTIDRVFRRKTFHVCDDGGYFKPLEGRSYHDPSHSESPNRHAEAMQGVDKCHETGGLRVAFRSMASGLSVAFSTPGGGLRVTFLETPLTLAVVPNDWDD